jgi:TPR repeat protein
MISFTHYAPLAIAGFAIAAWLLAARLGRREPASSAEAHASMPQTAPGAAGKLQVEHLYALGLEALRNNQFEQAARTLALAAARGHARAQLHYGVLCEHGIGVPVDIERARGLYQEAGAQGDVDAHFRLQVVEVLQARAA